MEGGAATPVNALSTWQAREQTDVQAAGPGHPSMSLPAASNLDGVTR